MTNFPAPFAGDRTVLLVDVTMNGETALFALESQPGTPVDTEAVVKFIECTSQERCNASVRIVLSGLSTEGFDRINALIPRLYAMRNLTQDAVIQLLKQTEN